MKLQRIAVLLAALSTTPAVAAHHKAAAHQKPIIGGAFPICRWLAPSSKSLADRSTNLIAEADVGLLNEWLKSPRYPQPDPSDFLCQREYCWWSPLVITAHG